METNKEPRKMFEGDWKCGACGKGITSLPFPPNPNHLERLKCHDCYKKNKEAEV